MAKRKKSSKKISSKRTARKPAKPKERVPKSTDVEIHVHPKLAKEIDSIDADIAKSIVRTIFGNVDKTNNFANVEHIYISKHRHLEDDKDTEHRNPWDKSCI